jgi:hypothetical protein
LLLAFPLAAFVPPVDFVALFGLLLTLPLLFGFGSSLFLIFCGVCDPWVSELLVFDVSFDLIDFGSFLIFVGAFTSGLIRSTFFLLSVADTPLLEGVDLRMPLASILTASFFNSAALDRRGESGPLFNSRGSPGDYLLSYFKHYKSWGSALANLPFSTRLTGFTNPPAFSIPRLLLAFSAR